MLHTPLDKLVKKQEISIVIVIIVSVIVIDKVFTLFVSLNKYQ